MSKIYDLKNYKEKRRTELRDQLDQLFNVSTSLGFLVSDMRQVKGESEKVKEAQKLFRHFKEKYRVVKSEYDSLK